ncbi:MAG: signal peptidase II [Oceanicoccus sp.]|jgi:signal peptidase II
MNIRRTVLWLLVTVTVVVLDQWTKSLASSELVYGRAVEVLPVFNFTLMHNSGAAFSFLSEAGGWQRWLFVGISSVVSLVLLVWMFLLKPKDIIMAASLSLILGGAIGNLWDRVLLGYVIDFISVHYDNHYFPAFNIADSAISIGAVLMILDMIINPERDSKATDDS